MNLKLFPEQSASSYLNAAPFKKQGFALNKTEFMDALNLRHFLELRGLPSRHHIGTRTECRQRTECRHGLISEMSVFSLSAFSPFLEGIPTRKCEPLLLTLIVIMLFGRVNDMHLCIV